VITTSVFSVVLTSKLDVGTNGRNERERVSGQATREVTAALRNFVSGCCDPGAGNCRTSGAYGCGPIHGPNTNNSNMWSFNDYVLSSGVASDSMGNVYAFTSGQHVLTNVLPAWFSGPPYNAQLSYTVTNSLTGSFTGETTPPSYPAAAYMPQVSVNVTWTEP